VRPESRPVLPSHRCSRRSRTRPSSAGRIGFIGSRAPALRISTSGTSSRTTLFIRVASVASPAITAAPACSAEERFARSRPIAITFAPQAATASTIASPSPWLPPVMTTRFPFSFCTFILLSPGIRRGGCRRRRQRGCRTRRARRSSGSKRPYRGWSASPLPMQGRATASR